MNCYERHRERVSQLYQNGDIEDLPTKTNGKRKMLKENRKWRKLYQTGDIEDLPTKTNGKRNPI